MEFESITLARLRELIEDRAWWDQPVLPITPWRARALTLNPRAREEDVLLVVAYHERRICGYISILPDMLYDGTGQPHRFGWLGTWWADPAPAIPPAGLKVMLHAAKAWNQHLAVSTCTPMAAAVFERLRNWTRLAVRESQVWLFRPDTRSLLVQAYQRRRAVGASGGGQPEAEEGYVSREDRAKTSKSWKARLLDAGAPVYGLLDAGFQFNYNRAFKRKFAQRGHAAPIQHGSSPDIPSLELEWIKRQQRREFTQKDRAMLEWICHHPWLLTRPTPSTDPSRYYFSSSARSLNFHFIQVLDPGGSVVGILLVRNREGIITLPFVRMESGHEERGVEALLAYLATVPGIRALHCLRPDIASRLAQRSIPCCGRTSAPVVSYITTELAQHLPSVFELQDGEGDSSMV